MGGIDGNAEVRLRKAGMTCRKAVQDTMTRHLDLRRLLGPWLVVLSLAVAVLAIASCGGDTPAKPVTDSEEALVRSEVEDRSFRQFEPSVDGDPRKGVVVDFTDGFRLWAQYAEGANAVNEWEIFSDEYSFEKHGSISEITVNFSQPRSSQTLPTMCTDCIDTAGVSVSIESVISTTNIKFKINDPNNVLPSPFPVFDSWTKFEEGEYVNGG